MLDNALNNITIEPHYVYVTGQYWIIRERLNKIQPTFLTLNKCHPRINYELTKYRTDSTFRRDKR